MHLYNILLMLHNDRQADIDTFIVREEPGVPQTQHPRKAAGVLETVYTRLRNELGHKRPGANLADTKLEMANHLGGLIALTKRELSCIRRRIDEKRFKLRNISRWRTTSAYAVRHAFRGVSA